MAAFYEFDPELATRVARFIRKYPESFRHITATDILCQSVREGSQPRGRKVYAEVKKVPDWMRAVTHFKVTMITHAENYEPLSDHTKNMVIVHELEHIQPHYQHQGEYDLKKHEVEDWSHMVRVLGPEWVEKLEEHPEFDIGRAKGFDSWQASLSGLASEMVSAQGHSQPRKAKRLRRRRR